MGILLYSTLSNAQLMRIFNEELGRGYGVLHKAEGVLMAATHDTVVALNKKINEVIAVGDGGEFTLYGYNEDKKELFVVVDKKFTALDVRGEIGKKYVVMIDSLGQELSYAIGNGSIEENISNRTKIGMNSEGLYALVKSNRQITGYSFNDLRLACDDRREVCYGFYEAVTDSGILLIDSLGNPVYPYAVDRYMPFYHHKGTFLATRGASSGFFSFDTEHSNNCPLLKIQDWRTTFEPEGGKAWGFIYQYYIIDRSGKYGLRDCDQNIIVPFEYDHMFFGTDQKTLVVEKNSKWQIIKTKNQKVLHEFEIDHWLGTAYSSKRDFGFFLRGGKMLNIDLKSFKESSDKILGKRSSRTIIHMTPDGEWLAYNEYGEIIMPIGKYGYLSFIRAGKFSGFLAKHEGTYGLYSLKGAMLLDHEYKRIQAVSRSEEGYFILSKDDKMGLLNWDSEQQEFKMVVDFEYRLITRYYERCNYCVGEPAVKGQKMDGTWYYIYPDGKLKKKR